MNDSDSRALPPQPTSLCMRYQPLLALLRTDALSPQEAAPLDEHLSICRWCQRELAAYDALDAAARQHLSTVPFTPFTLEDIMQTPQTPTQTSTQTSPANATATPTRNEVRGTASPRPSGRPPISVLGPLAAVMALILLAGLIFTTHGSGPTPGSGTPIPTTRTATPPTVSQQTAALAQSTWTLTQLVVDAHEQPLVFSHAPTLHFYPHDAQSGEFGGNGGCNFYSGSYTLTSTTLHMGGENMLQVACPPYPRPEDNSEAAYLRALPRAQRFHLDGNLLTLTSADGSVRLTFHGTRDVALTQTTWTLTELVVDGYEQPLVPAHAPTLHLQPQDNRSGMIQGTGGCNSYSGSYTLTGTTLHMSVSEITNKACPPDVMDEEQAYLDALPQIKLFHLEGDTLTMASGDGSAQLIFHA